MIVSNDISYSHNTPCVVALGCFDGVHIGHVAVIQQAIDIAKELTLPSCIWSFAEPPKRFYDPSNAPLLTTAAQKQEIISSLGADVYLTVSFDEKIASISPDEFFDRIIIGNLKAHCVVCGFDFTFGKGGCGNTQTLEKLCAKKGISFVAVPSVELNGMAVSSSTIRSHILCGRMDEAQKLLGRPYSISSVIVDGKHLGRNLGFPTINQKISHELCVPKHGVYLTRIILDSSQYFGITNIGTQPTVGGHDTICETNIFDFSGYLYGKNAKIEFLKFIRPEKKFASVDELAKQVHEDIARAKELSK